MARHTRRKGKKHNAGVGLHRLQERIDTFPGISIILSSIGPWAAQVQRAVGGFSSSFQWDSHVFEGVSNGKEAVYFGRT